jgi:hypothetical protein
MRRGRSVAALFLLGAWARGEAQEPTRIACAASPDAAAAVRTFERWMDDVWTQGRVELLAELVQPLYVRHELDSSRTITAAAYASEIATVRRALPDVRFFIHDCAAINDRLWVRWSMVGTSAATGGEIRRKGMQVYRLQDGRLAETWNLMPPIDGVWRERITAPARRGAPPSE